MDYEDAEPLPVPVQAKYDITVNSETAQCAQTKWNLADAWVATTNRQSRLTCHMSRINSMHMFAHGSSGSDMSLMAQKTPI